MVDLTTTKMSSKGQVVIPEETRKRLGLSSGDRFVVVGEEDVVVLKRIRTPDVEQFRNEIDMAEVAAASVEGGKAMTDIVQRIVKAVSPGRIVLFGSAGRGEIGPDSDVDLLVVVPVGTHRRRASQRIHEHLAGTGIAIDVVVATEDDIVQYGKESGMIYQHALREGREIYVA